MNGMDRITQLPGFKPALPETNPVSGTDKGFGATLKQFIGDVNEMQVSADVKTQQFATGEIKDIHEVMAASEEASISMMLLLEIRNKALDGYKELMRTPV
ncbi:flagellar hook-basal body complex protein FliE [candidate division KSB1 bacterium]|nr:flagellar hook-basal body complex protein FliE [candidate division KSB1 bacterium]